MWQYKDRWDLFTLITEILQEFDIFDIIKLHIRGCIENSRAKIVNGLNMLNACLLYRLSATFFFTFWKKKKQKNKKKKKKTKSSCKRQLVGTCLTIFDLWTRLVREIFPGIWVVLLFSQALPGVCVILIYKKTGIWKSFSIVDILSDVEQVHWLDPADTYQ